jgi:hypothetical protein
LNNFFWAVWSIRMIKEENFSDAKVFNFDSAVGRVKLFNKVKELYFK